MRREITEISTPLCDLSLKELNSMKILEAVVLETLRKHPPVTFGSRVCSKDCIITTKDGEQLKFLKGDQIHIPIQLIGNDINNFSDPEAFNPYRVTTEESLAFGLGPKSCPGAALVKILLKTLIFSILSKFSIEQRGKLHSTTDHKLFLILIPSQ